MEEILKQLIHVLEKDCLDYIAIFAPIVLSAVAITISMWNSFWSKEIKKAEADLVWDELNQLFFIIIRNTGNKTLIIESVSLSAYDKKAKNTYELGTRNNAWTVIKISHILNLMKLQFSLPYTVQYTMYLLTKDMRLMLTTIMRN